MLTRDHQTRTAKTGVAGQSTLLTQCSAIKNCKTLTGNFIHNIKSRAYQTFSAVTDIMGYSHFDIPVLLLKTEMFDSSNNS